MPAKKTSQRKKIVLLDSHAILHRAYHAMPDFASSNGEPTGALYGIATMIFSIIKELKPDYVVAAFDLPKPTYRHEAYADYKAGRRKTDDELIKQINRSRDLFAAFQIPIYEKEGYEADDVLGTLAKQLKDEFDVIIASGDMDTLQLVDDDRVKVYTLKKGIKDTILYDEKAVIDRFGFKPVQIPDYKGLRGDASDNIIGVAGIGEKTATDLIVNFGTVEGIYKALEKFEIENEDEAAKNKKEKTKNLNNEKVLEKFKKAGIKERIVGLLKENQEEAEFSKMLATIQCDVPVKFEAPEKTWFTTINPEKIKELFRELEFRSLLVRVDSIFGEASAENLMEATVEDVDPEKLAEAKIMVWLLNSTIANPTLEDIYIVAKTKNFDEAYQKLFAEIQKKELEFVFEKIEKPLIPVIREMERNGVRLDIDFLKKLSEEYHFELDKIQKEIWHDTGHEFNINSPSQMAEVLFDKLGLSYKGMRKTATGKFSTKEDVLQKLAEENPIAEKILEYRELQKLLSTYIDNFPLLIGEDGRLHATFLQTGTTTGRMSSNNPNLQNIPIGSERGQRIRQAFTAEKGKKLLALDYSQFELRIAAFLSGEKKLIEIFKVGTDIHTAVAAEVFGVSLDEVTKEMRRQAKVINFGMLYGMGINALRQNLKTDRKSAQEFYNKYFLVYGQLSKYLENAKTETAQKGYTKTFFGRRRYFDGFNSSLPFIRAQAERMAINAPIQGTLADISKLALVQVDNFLQEKKIKDQVKLILQIHDEAVYEVDEKIVEEIAPQIQKIMEDVLTPDKTSGVPITVDYKIADNWGGLK
jgi:DNA polymerase-1